MQELQADLTRQTDLLTANPPRPVGVTATPADHAPLWAVAERLANDLGLPLVYDPAATRLPVVLTVTPQRLELRVTAGEPDLQGGRPIAPELARLDVSSPPGGRLNQPLFRAVGLKKGRSERPRVLDATAGFGEDAWLLASKGCPVLAIERHGVIAVLLRDALRRAAEAQPDLAARIDVLHEDARELLRSVRQKGYLDLPAAQPWREEPTGEADPDAADAAETEPPTTQWPRPDVVYIDPMFPAGRRAMERKPMRLLRRVVGQDLDSGELLALALSVAARRVVVKRARKAPALGGRPPATTHRGRSLRYDVYLAEGA